MRDILQVKGYPVHDAEFSGAHDYLCWQMPMMAIRRKSHYSIINRTYARVVFRQRDLSGLRNLTGLVLRKS